MNTPLLLLIFNRPGHVARLIDSLRPLRPEKLYVAADGPRPDKAGEAELCAASRAELKRIDWPCRVETLLRKRNLGCGLAVSGGIDWFFEQESEGVILEDDVAASPDFFRFCRIMLERYRDEPRVMQITGNNFRFAAPSEPMPCLFSSFPHIWGWATWARAWRHFSLAPDNMRAFVRDDLPRLLPDREAAAFWARALNQTMGKERSVWGYQWCKALLERRGLSLAPGNNLAANEGFGAGATHTGQGRSMGQRLRPGSFGTLAHVPARLEADAEYDAYLCRYFFSRRAPGPDAWLEEAQRRLARGEPASCLTLLDAVEAVFLPWRPGEPAGEYALIRRRALAALDAGGSSC